MGRRKGGWCLARLLCLGERSRDGCAGLELISSMVVVVVLLLLSFTMCVPMEGRIILSRERDCNRYDQIGQDDVVCI